MILDKTNIRFGKYVSISDSCIFEKIKPKNPNGFFSFGDYCKIYANCRFYTSSEFIVGDYGTIHNNTFFTGYKPCSIGHNVWIGQNSIINATDKLKIGNNCGIGAYSKIWTHAAFGDLILGCKILVGIPDLNCKSGAVTIGDDFWGIGQITISPGVNIGDKVIALTNSLITKDIPSNTIVAGIPAKPIMIDGDFYAYKDLKVSEKFDLMKKFATQFASTFNIQIKIDDTLQKIILGNHEIVIKCNDDAENFVNTSYFDIIKRTYTKKHNPLERKFMEFVLGYRARFIPEY